MTHPLNLNLMTIGLCYEVLKMWSHTPVLLQGLQDTTVFISLVLQAYL